MRINLINQKPISFNALYIHDNSKNKLSDEQKEIFKTTEATFNKPYSKDKKGRSYLEYLEKYVGKDYYIEKSRFNEKALDLYESFVFYREKEYRYLATLTKEQPLNDEALIYECNDGKDITQIKKLLTAAHIIAVLLILLAIGKFSQKRFFNKPMEEKTTVIVNDSLNKISKDSLNIKRYFIKK